MKVSKSINVLKKALKFYANPDNYQGRGLYMQESGNVAFGTGKIEKDNGKIAQEALSVLEEKDNK